MADLCIPEVINYIFTYIIDNLDIDECSSTHNCTELQNCANTPGSFECTCRPGYRESLTSPLRCEGNAVKYII